jgi:hypothetical protein
VALVKYLTKAPQTKLWRRGEFVYGNPSIEVGTGIATFDRSGRYPQKGRDMNSAVFLRGEPDRIIVLDQFPEDAFGRPRPAQPRSIFPQPGGAPEDDANAYSVILCQE